MELRWNNPDKPWEYEKCSKSFFRTLFVLFEDRSGALIRVSLTPPTVAQGKTHLQFSTIMEGALHVLTEKKYPDIMVADMEFFAPYIAYYEMKHWLSRQKYK